MCSSLKREIGFDERQQREKLAEREVGRMAGGKQERESRNGKEKGGGGAGGRNGKRPPAQTPLKQKHPFSSENKPPSQDLREWATSAGRGSSNEGQDVPLRTHLRRAEGQKPEYIDPSLSLCHCPALPSHPGRVASVPLKKKRKTFSPPCLPAFLPISSPPTSQRGGKGGRGTVLSIQRQRGKGFP